MKKQLVSIIMPAYNSEKYIRQSIESVINQEYQEWELLVVDDCSTDNTCEVVESIISYEQRIKLFRQPFNQGVSEARNRAIKEANGRFIAFLDSDDIWKEEKLSSQISFMLKNNYSFTFTSYELIDKNGNKKDKIFSVPSIVTYNQYLKNTIIGCLTVILDRSILKNINVPEGPLEDVLMWMSILKLDINAYGLNENLASYRVSSGSVSSNKLKNAKLYYDLLRKRENLTVLRSIYCHINYSFNASRKRLF